MKKAKKDSRSLAVFLNRQGHLDVQYGESEEVQDYVGVDGLIAQSELDFTSSSDSAIAALDLVWLLDLEHCGAAPHVLTQLVLAGVRMGAEHHKKVLDALKRQSPREECP